MNKQHVNGKSVLLSAQVSGGEDTQDNGGGGGGVEPPKLN
ncbi:hypothetical protein HOR41_gp05 [Pseudoalteromonas phage C5a]|uniref:Uncharacterized protein n=1 Tax=Pseudoalteromonas phage C5a TaxID=1916107 RepID=A0A1L5C266_9CAUD|nr:hypothetical protein HOR41_gp05 [Pseudoalteromonas phage C5a]APM00215.1 hypothetical protein C5a_5 [Pseudoalteromonas phage C5a]KPZ59550.1 hypothetical protein AN389_02696 [Pseudoalteromonas sp. P1-7a]|tara:strand:+ start:225 stop:344 length:120 start_codon:yes stop_codon:yes gene_type:complete